MKSNDKLLLLLLLFLANPRSVISINDLEEEGDNINQTCLWDFECLVKEQFSMKTAPAIYPKKSSKLQWTLLPTHFLLHHSAIFGAAWSIKTKIWQQTPFTPPNYQHARLCT